MNRIVSFCTLLVFCFVASCTTILDTHATNAGYSGAGGLAGPPPGDSVASRGNVLYNGGALQLALQGTTPNSVELFPGGKPHNADSYLINFRGVKLTITETPILRIVARGDGGRIACSLDIAGGEFRLNGGSGTVVAGPYTGNADLHRVLLRLDNRTNRCFLNIRQYMQASQSPNDPQTLPVINANVPYEDPDFDELDRVLVSWESVQPDDFTSYFLGPMIISTN